MKVVRTISPNRKTEDTVTGTLHGPNDYQYYREYDNSWELSVVCNYAVFDYEKGLFEVAVRSNVSEDWTVVARAYNFKEVAMFIEEFEIDPKTATSSRSIEIENGI